MSRNHYDPGPAARAGAALVAGVVLVLAGALVIGGHSTTLWTMFNGGQW